MELLTNGWNIVLILLGFGLLIFVHELGHFLAARWAGIRCESFAVGMGPPVLAYRPGVGFALGSTDPRAVAKFGKPVIQMTDEELASNGVGETEYSLRALPLGGFVRMLGQDDMNPAEISSQPRGYQRTPVWKRMIVVSAGVTANLIGAIVMFVVAFMVGVKFDAPVVGAVQPGSSAATAVARNAAEAGVSAVGLQPGDRILRIGGSETLTFADVQIGGAMARAGSPQLLQVQRPGVAQELDFQVIPKFEPRIGLQWFGIDPARSTTIVLPTRKDEKVIATILVDAGLSRAGITAGSTLRTVNGKEVAILEDVREAFSASDGRPIDTTWSLPGGATVSAALDPEPQFQLLIEAGGHASGKPKEDDARSFQFGLLGFVPLMKVRSVAADSPNLNVLQDGDVLLRAGATVGPTPLSLQATLKEYGDKSIPLEVLRDGKRVTLAGQINGKHQLGIVPTPCWESTMQAAPMAALGPPPEETGAARASPAARLDMLPLSRIIKVAGEPVASWREIRSALQRATQDAAAHDQAATVEVEWEMPTPGHEAAVGRMIVPAHDAKELAALSWSMPIPSPLFEPVPTTLQADGNPITAAGMGFRQTAKMITMTYLTIDRIFRGSVGVEQLRGPVGIVHLGSSVADRGMTYLIFFLAAISVNLAVLNFLPLPIVDGGLFLYLVYERIVGKPPSARFQNAAIAVGLCLIGGIFLLTFYQDVMRLVSGS